MRCYHINSLRLGAFIQDVAAIGLVSDQFLVFSSTNLASRVNSTSLTSCGEALAAHMETGRPAGSAIAMAFVPLPRLIFPTQSPLFSHYERAIDKALREVEAPSRPQVLS